MSTFVVQKLKEFFAAIAMNGFATFGPDKAKQVVTVNPDGHVIGDGILFGLGKEEFSLVGRPAAADYAAFMAETSRSRSARRSAPLRSHSEAPALPMFPGSHAGRSAEAD